MSNLPRPAEKIALVTGAGSGIGRAVSIALHVAGFTVFLAGRRKEQLLETAKAGGDDSGKMIPVRADLADPASVHSLFEEVRSRCGRLDLLFNNAGTNAPAVPLEELTLEQWNAVVAVNLTGAFLCAQQAFKLMKEQSPRGGRI